MRSENSETSQTCKTRLESIVLTASWVSSTQPDEYLWQEVPELSVGAQWSSGTMGDPGIPGSKPGRCSPRPGVGQWGVPRVRHQAGVDESGRRRQSMM